MVQIVQSVQYVHVQIVTAAAVSSAVMFALAAKAVLGNPTPNTKKELIQKVVDFGCYFTLGMIGIKSALSAAELKDILVKTKGYHTIKNDTNSTMGVYKDGKCIKNLFPGESVELGYNITDKSGEKVVFTTETYNRYNVTKKELVSTSTRYDHRVKVVRGLSPQNYPSLPLGGKAIVTKDLT